MDSTRQLRNPDKISIKQLAKSNRNSAAHLGDVVRKIMDERISPRQAKFGSIAEIWSQLLPPELEQHCRLAEIASGQLKVVVDSPPHLRELRLCTSELLTELQRQCPQARIRDIRFTIGQITCLGS